jgi:hypothetical protein
MKIKFESKKNEYFDHKSKNESLNEQNKMFKASINNNDEIINECAKKQVLAKKKMKKKKRKKRKKKRRNQKRRSKKRRKKRRPKKTRRRIQRFKT